MGRQNRIYPAKKVRAAPTKEKREREEEEGPFQSVWADRHNSSLFDRCMRESAIRYQDNGRCEAVPLRSNKG